MDTSSEPLLSEAAWAAIVGQDIGARSRPVTLVGAERNTLLIEVKSAAWAQQIGFLSARIVSKLRDRGVKAEHLRLRIAPRRLRE